MHPPGYHLSGHFSSNYKFLEGSFIPQAVVGELQFLLTIILSLNIGCAAAKPWANPTKHTGIIKEGRRCTFISKAELTHTFVSRAEL